MKRCLIMDLCSILRRLDLARHTPAFLISGQSDCPCAIYNIRIGGAAHEKHGHVTGKHHDDKEVEHEDDDDDVTDIDALEELLEEECAIAEKMNRSGADHDCDRNRQQETGRRKEGGRGGHAENGEGARTTTTTPGTRRGNGDNGGGGRNEVR